jgi:hypothetical protein
MHLNAQQKASVDSMYRLEQSGSVYVSEDRVLYTTMGINGNVTGSGKTRAMVALIEKELSFPDRPLTYVTARGTHAHEVLTMSGLSDKRITVILANASIRKQWSIELQQSSLRHMVIDNIRKLSALNEDCQVIVVNTTVYKRLASMPVRWRRFIYDEADSHLVPSMPRLHAAFTWFVTATWRVLERFTSTTTRKKGELFNMLKGIPLHLIVIVNDIATDGLPPIQTIRHTYRQPSSIVGAVERHLNVDILRQIDAGDIQGAVLAMGGNSSTSNIVDIVRTRMTRSLEEAEYRLSRGGNNDHWQSRVTQIKTDIRQVNVRFHNILTDDTCAICTDSFTNPALTPCHHVYCLQCIATWIHTTPSCPHCRACVRPDQITTLLGECGGTMNSGVDRAHNQTNLTRMDILDTIVNKTRVANQRILIFSEHDASFDMIKQLLPSSSYGLLRGHSTTRERILAEYRAGSRPILLLNSRMNGAGIDLPFTTDIVLFHSMPLELETQAIGRGQRIGRTSPLRVHRFVSTP